MSATIDSNAKRSSNTPGPRSRPPGRTAEEAALVEQALRDRELRARKEKMSVRSSDATIPWTDYSVTSAASEKIYRVALRGMEPGASYCSCPDFRKNTLGTCKHIIRVIRHVQKRFKAEQRNKPYQRQGFSVVVQYGANPALRLLAPADINDAQRVMAGPLLHGSIDDVSELLFLVRGLEVSGASVTIYPDAEEQIQTRLVQARVRELAEEIRFNPSKHPMRQRLLSTELLPHELDGIAFAAAAGRAILADDVGLSKTIQGIGTAELLAQESHVKRVLVICPASSKSQWCGEIARFSHRDCTLISGTAKERSRAYRRDSFFTVCNYEQVLRDIAHIEEISWDMIILDDGKRIQNWEAKTSRIVKGLQSRFALVVTGSLLENRLEDLFSIVEFIDETRLGPAFRLFLRDEQQQAKSGEPFGYDELQEKLAPILLHRTRETGNRSTVAAPLGHIPAPDHTPLPAHKRRLAAAGGHLVQSAFNFLHEVIPDRPNTPESDVLVERFKQGLSECLEYDAEGNVQLTVTLTEPAALDDLAETMAKLIPAGCTS